MAYCPDNTTLFWSDPGSDKISHSGIYGGTTTEIVTTGLDNPYGIVVDTANSTVYYADWGTNTIKRSSVSGTDEVTIASGLSDPRGLAIDSNNSKLYWCDDLADTLVMSNLDGTDQTTIVSGMNAVGVAVDTNSNKIYWTVADASGSIMKADLDGSNMEYMGYSEPLGDVVTSYSAQTFYEHNVFIPRAIRLTDTTHALVYTHSNSHNTELYCRIIEYSDHIATSGDEVLIQSGTIYPAYAGSVNLQRINDTQFFIVFGQDSGTDLVVCSLSGTLSVSVDSKTALDTQFMYEMYPTELSPQTPTSSGTYIVAGKSLSNNYVYDRVVAISGTTAITGSRLSPDGELSHTTYLAVAPFNSSEFVTFFAPTSTDSRYRYGSVSGLDITFGESGVIGDNKKVQLPISQKLETDKVALFGSILSEDNKIYTYSLGSSGNITETLTDGIHVQHSDKHAMVVLDSSILALCTYEEPTTSVQICKLSGSSGVLGDIITKDVAAYLWLTKITDNSFTLYSADTTATIGQLEVFSIAGGGSTNTSGILSYPKPITIDTTNNSIYWSNEYDGEKAEICRIDISGVNSGVVVPTDIGYKNVYGLAVEPADQKVYIASSGNGTISKIDLDGSNPEILASNLPKPLGISLVPAPVDAINLYLKVVEPSNDSTNLFVKGPIFKTNSTNLYLEVTKQKTNTSNLYIGGIGSSVVSDKIATLTRAQDYDPQIISSFANAATSVNVELWNITNGANTVISISNSGCYSIGNTGKWGWSTEYLPQVKELSRQHCYFRMTSDTGEEQCNEFIFTFKNKNVIRRRRVRKDGMG